MVKLRALFIDKSYLAKPLLALRNPVLYKNFRKLFLYTKQKKFLKYSREISSYAMYLRLQRKCFYALRLNAAARY